MIALKVGNVEIPTRAGLDLEQTYTPIGGETILRTLNGTGIKQTTWAKLRTTISGSGWSPTGLSLLDTTVPQSVACIMPRAVIADANRQATLPAARRGDSGALPWAWALLPSGDAVNTTITMAGNVATAGAVSGAIGYQIFYLPLLNCWVGRPTESGSRGDASYRWEVQCEEV